MTSTETEHGVRAMGDGGARAPVWQEREGERVVLQVSLPAGLASAIIGAARAARRIDGKGRVVMDHLMLADPALLTPRSMFQHVLDCLSKATSKAV